MGLSFYKKAFAATGMAFVACQAPASRILVNSHHVGFLRGGGTTYVIERMTAGGPAYKTFLPASDEQAKCLHGELHVGDFVAYSGDNIDSITLAVRNGRTVNRPVGAECKEFSSQRPYPGPPRL